MAFKRTITVVAIILLVVIFVFMIFFMGRQNADVIYPPVVNKCPDYWDYDNGDNKCKNTFGMKKNTSDTNDIDDLILDFSQGTAGKCGKRDWSIQNGLTWDGITNNEKLDCSEY
tara:strand:- start:137 stop:478 length:342 start_codon:yes stop_codon:yes gene_type:complete